MFDKLKNNYYCYVMNERFRPELPETNWQKLRRVLGIGAAVLTVSAVANGFIQTELGQDPCASDVANPLSWIGAPACEATRDVTGWPPKP